MNNKKISSLLNKGIKFESLKMLNETQINTLYTAVIGEQESLTDKVDDVKQMGAELSQLNQQIDQTIQKIGRGMIQRRRFERAKYVLRGVAEAIISKRLMSLLLSVPSIFPKIYFE